MTSCLHIDRSLEELDAKWDMDKYMRGADGEGPPRNPGAATNASADEELMQAEKQVIQTERMRTAPAGH